MEGSWEREGGGKSKGEERWRIVGKWMGMRNCQMVGRWMKIGELWRDGGWWRMRFAVGDVGRGKLEGGGEVNEAFSGH